MLSLINWIAKGKGGRARFLFVRLGTSERNSTETGGLLMTNGNGGNRSCCGSLFHPYMDSVLSSRLRAEVIIAEP